MSSKHRKLALAIALLVILDQIVKALVVSSAHSYILNTGLAISILEASPSIAMILNAIGIIGLLVMLSRGMAVTVGQYAAFGLVIAGGVSNIFDRIFRGGVIDYISFSFWPTTFNLADVFVVLGLCLILVYSLINEKKVSKSGGSS